MHNARSLERGQRQHLLTAPTGTAGPSDDVDFDVNVSAGGLRVRADLVCSICELPGGLAIDARQIDIEASREEEVMATLDQVDFGVNRGIRWDRDLAGKSGTTNRTKEAGGPTGTKELLGVRARAAAARTRELDIKSAVVAAGGSVASGCRVGAAGVNDFNGLRHRKLRWGEVTS